jgi:hypothetical protein
MTEPYLEEYPSCTKKIVDYGLWAALEEAQRPSQPEDYTEPFLQRFSVLSSCAVYPSTRIYLLERVSALSKHSLNHLATALRDHIAQWSEVYRPIYEKDRLAVECSVPILLLVVALNLFSARGFAKAITKSGFLSSAVSAGREFAQSRSSSPGPGLFAGHVSWLVMCIVFDGDNIKTILSLTPSLLDAGLLQLLVEDLFTVGDSHIRPFNQWDGGEGLTPLQRLYAVSHYPRVTQALLRALGSTTLNESAVLAHPNLDKRAVTFGAAILVYKPALSAYCSASAITEPCCSLEVSPVLNPTRIRGSSCGSS